MKTEKLESLHRLAEEIIRDDEAGREALQYTRDDVIAATVVFSHIMGARFVQYLEHEKVGIKAGRRLTKDLGNRIGGVVSFATDLDIKIKEIV